MPLRILVSLIFSVLTAPAFASDLPPPVVVVLGGYASCADDGHGGISPFGGNMTAQGVELVNNLNTHPETVGVRWIFSCFDLSSNLYVQASSDPSVLDAGNWDMSLFVKRIEALSDNYARPIYVIGHSHGGWLAMQTVEALRQPMKNGFLATIDPISFPDCNASTFADALLADPTGAWDDLSPCRRAPTDITAMDLRQIRKNLGPNLWRHWWQQEFAPLHSSEIPGGPDFSLDMSAFFNSYGTASSWIAHKRIASFEPIWFTMQTVILRDYGI